jgi:hypothetical protein
VRKKEGKQEIHFRTTAANLQLTCMKAEADARRVAATANFILIQLVD